MPARAPTPKGTTMKKLIIALMLISSTQAYADKQKLPDFDFKDYCRYNPLGREACIGLENSANTLLRGIWRKLSENDQAYCLDGAKTYMELWQCAEIKAPQDE
jgi:hypothetical protein